MISLQNLKFTQANLNTVDNSTHEYLNIEIVNEYSLQNTEPKSLIFRQVKASNIVDVTGDYFLSVVRWNIQANLPVLVPEMELFPPGTRVQNTTIYKVSLLYTTGDGDALVYNLPTMTGSTFSQKLFFDPEIINTQYLQTLTAPSDREDVLNNPYYYLRSVDSFLTMINYAIQVCLSRITGAVWAHLPYFIWDPATQKITYNRPNSIPTGVPGGDANTQWYLAVNQPLYNLLNTFRFVYIAPNAQNQSMFPENLDCRYLLDTNILPSTSESTGEYTTYTQQSSSVVNWSPVQSIVFTSGTIPVEPQLSGAPQNLNIVNPSNESSIYQQQGISRVITDFSIPFSSGIEATNQQVYYIPTSEYRLIDLLGNNNLNELTIQVFWRDKYGVLHPMTLDAGASASILILLRKKSYNHQKTE